DVVGQPGKSGEPGRSIPVSTLAPLWEIPGSRWFSLQVGSPTADITHLGHPVWVPLAVPAWSWLLERNDSPRYPTMHLLRQTIAGDWTPVIEIVRSRGALA